MDTIELYLEGSCAEAQGSVTRIKISLQQEVVKAADQDEQMNKKALALAPAIWTLFQYPNPSQLILAAL